LAEDLGNDVKPGKVEEIIAEGDSIIKSYLNGPDETALAIRKGWHNKGGVATIGAEADLYCTNKEDH